MISEPLNNRDEGSAEPEFYFVRRKGTVGLTYELGRTNFSYGDEAPLYLFEDLLSAIEQLHFFGLDSDRAGLLGAFSKYRTYRDVIRRTFADSLFHALG